MNSIIARAESFAVRLGVRMPILLAPMAGACPPSLSIAVAHAGGLGACGAVLMKPEEIVAWCAEFRAQCAGEFQINLWIPDPPAERDREGEACVRDFLAQWGPTVSHDAGDSVLHDFDAQCRAVLAEKPKAISSIMGLFPPAIVQAMKEQGVLWFATATTVSEARAAEAAGADAIVAQGMEAGGHRGAFCAADAERALVGLVSLLPLIADAVSIPVIAAGGIADARGVAAALILGASAVTVGTGFLRSPEAQTPSAYSDRIAQTEAEETTLTRAFSGRVGRAIANNYTRAAAAAGAPSPAAYPVQRGFLRAMREAARQAGDAERMQMWAGQSARLARAEPAADIARELWEGAKKLL